MDPFGTVYTVNAVAPTMKEQRLGKIITVRSIAGTGRSVGGGHAHYGAAKVTITHLTRHLAQDLGPFGTADNYIATLWMFCAPACQDWVARYLSPRCSDRSNQVSTTERKSRILHSVGVGGVSAQQPKNFGLPSAASRSYECHRLQSPLFRY